MSYLNDFYPGVGTFLTAARAGYGEQRSVREAPGHLLAAHPYQERDQLKISRAQAQEAEIVIALISITLMSDSDAWLVTEGSQDRIELWEGHVFFHSADDYRLGEARELLSEFDCKPLSA